MALPLILLAVGSIFAGYVGVPHALGGSNRIEIVPRAVLRGARCAACGHGGGRGSCGGTCRGRRGPRREETHADVGTERLLMGISVGVAFAGIFIAMYFWLRNRSAADRMAQSFGGVYRLLLDKYRIDELYDTIFVQPIKLLSTVGLWRGVDAGLIDGAVNGVGAMISGSSSVLRRIQTGSVRTYAFGLFAGAVAILGYYLLR